MSLTCQAQIGHEWFDKFQIELDYLFLVASREHGGDFYFFILILRFKGVS